MISSLSLTYHFSFATCPRTPSDSDFSTILSTTRANSPSQRRVVALRRSACREFRAGRARGRRAGGGGRRRKVRCVEVFKKRKWLGAVGARARSRVALNFTWSTFNLRRTKPCRHGRALRYYIDGGFMKLWPSGTCIAIPCNRRFYLLVWSLIFHQFFSRTIFCLSTKKRLSRIKLNDIDWNSEIGRSRFGWIELFRF